MCFLSFTFSLISFFYCHLCAWRHILFYFTLFSLPLASNPSSDTASVSSGLCETEASNHSLPPSPRPTENETVKKAEEEVPEEETEEEKAKRLLYCSLCKVAVNSASQLQAHKSGEKLCSSLDVLRLILSSCDFMCAQVRSTKRCLKLEVAMEPSSRSQG